MNKFKTEELIINIEKRQALQKKLCTLELIKSSTTASHAFYSITQSQYSIPVS